MKPRGNKSKLVVKVVRVRVRVRVWIFVYKYQECMSVYIYISIYICTQWKLVFEFYCVIITQTRKLQTHSFILIYFPSQ